MRNAQGQRIPPAAAAAKLREVLAKEPHVLAAHAFLATPAGSALRQRLEALFVRGELMGDSIEETYFNLGAREVVLYLTRLPIAVDRAAEAERTGQDG